MGTDGVVRARDVEGLCKWFADAKGYGFIRARDIAEDIIVHHTEILAPGFRTLTAGQRVVFDLVQTPKGLAAKRVRPTDDQGAMKCPRCEHVFILPVLPEEEDGRRTA